MTTNKAIELPKTVDELQEAIRKGIESFQGSPAKNPNKLRTALAKGLNFNNYDELSVILKAQADEEENKVIAMDFDISEFGHNKIVTINDTEIYDSIFQEQKSLYYFFDRLDEIEEIQRMIGETYGYDVDSHRESQRPAMVASLDELKSYTDEFILGNINDREYISPTEHPQAFNNACEEILAVQAEHTLRNTKSISDDDKCTDCKNCQYRPGDESGCKLAPNQGDQWPAKFDDDNYAISCVEFKELGQYDDNKI